MLMLIMAGLKNAHKFSPVTVHSPSISWLLLQNDKIHNKIYRMLWEMSSQIPIKWLGLSFNHFISSPFFSFQKCDGTCRTDFKKTRSKQDVIQVFKDFVGGNVNIIVRESPLASSYTHTHTHARYIHACKDTLKTYFTVHIHKTGITWQTTPATNTPLDWALWVIFCKLSPYIWKRLGLMV